MVEMKYSYDPFNREDEAELERERAAREEHEAWSREQARLGNAAGQRENVGVWVKRFPDTGEQ